MRHQIKYERGQALILIVFGIIGLIGITALAVDGGKVYAERRQAQNAADSAALGGALARIRGADWVAAAYQVAEENGYNNDGVTNFVSVVSPPADGPYEGDLEYIQVTISAHVPTYFAGVLGIQQTDLRVQTMSRTKAPEIKEILDGNAVISLAPTSDCMNKKSFWIHGEATLDMTDAGVFVNSSNQECALIQQGSGSIRIENGDVFVVGGASIQKPKLFTPYPIKTGVAPISYPPPFLLPRVGCGAKEAIVSPDGASMTPGNWDDEFPPEGVHYLEPGVYCVTDFIMDGGDWLEGTNVTFKVDGQVRWGGQAQINLDAPNSGYLAGLLLYAPMKNENMIVLNGNAESAISGTILAPASEIRINGGDSTYGFHSQIIGYRINVNGTSNIIIKYVDEQNWDTMTMPEIQLIK